MATKLLPIVSKVYCSPSPVVLGVRMRPNVANGGGFAVADFSQGDVLFSVDGCGIIGRKEEMILRDAEGNPLLLIRRKILMERGRGHRAPAPQKHCTIEYDGASKGNPGQAGAGAVVRHPDGTIAARLSQGLGNATNNAAEYKGAIIGLKYARDNGYTHVSMKGDSQLVTKQVQGEWQTRNPNMAELCNEVRGLTDGFTSFEASHVPRGYNTDADAQANRGVHLKDGEVRGEYY